MYKLKCVSVREKLGNGLRLLPTPFSTCRQTEALETSKKTTKREKQRSKE